MKMKAPLVVNVAPSVEVALSVEMTLSQVTLSVEVADGMAPSWG